MEKICIKILRDGFETSDQDEHDFIQELETKAFTSTHKELTKCARNINDHVIRKFKELFNRNEEGNVREWYKIDEEDIVKIWESCCVEMKKYFDWFKHFDIPKHVNATPLTRGESFGEAKETLLDSQTLARAEDRFKDDSEQLLEDAKRAHHGFASGGIPIYFWILLVFFGYDDLLRYCGSPIVFYPLLLIGSLIALMFSLGMGSAFNVAIPVARHSANMMIRKTGLGFQI